VSAAILDRLREKLDEALPRGDSARTLFEALARWGPRVPADERELASFVHGTLKSELEGRLQRLPLKRLLDELDQVLTTAEALTADHEIPIEIDEAPRWRDEVSTKAMRAITGPVPVLIVAGTGALAIRLRAVLGDDVIEVEARGDAAGVQRGLGAGPALAIVDALDVTPIAIDTLADAIVHATATKTIVWGSELAYGRRMIDAADVRGVDLSGVALADGFGAILDLVISRRA
jgi:hypothetical protein